MQEEGSRRAQKTARGQEGGTQSGGRARGGGLLCPVVVLLCHSSECG